METASGDDKSQKDLRRLEATKDVFTDFTRADLIHFGRISVVAAFGFGLLVGLLLGFLFWF